MRSISIAPMSGTPLTTATIAVNPNSDRSASFGQVLLASWDSHILLTLDRVKLVVRRKFSSHLFFSLSTSPLNHVSSTYNLYSFLVFAIIVRRFTSVTLSSANKSKWFMALQMFSSTYHPFRTCRHKLKSSISQYES